MDPQELITVQDIYNHEAAEATGTVNNQLYGSDPKAAALQAQWGTLYPPHMVKGSKSAVADNSSTHRDLPTQLQQFQVSHTRV